MCYQQGQSIKSTTTPNYVLVNDLSRYQYCFELDLRNAYETTKHLGRIEDKISYWSSMDLLAEQYSQGKISKTKRKTWIMLCLLMANKELKFTFTKEELKSLDKDMQIKCFNHNLMTYNSIGDYKSWRSWAGCAHIRQTTDGVYTLFWV